MIFVWILVFLVALATLIISSDEFTKSAEKFGLHFGMNPFLVGIIIVSIGTSLPELIAGIVAMSVNSSEIVIGNVIGSNITNLFLVLGLTATIAAWKKPISFHFDFATVDMPIFITSAVLLFFALVNGVFNLAEAILFFMGYLIYMFYSISLVKESKIPKKEESLMQKTIPQHYQKKGFPAKRLLYLVTSAIFIYVGAKFMVEAIINMSVSFGVGTEVIALSAVALGTSLPELSVSIATIRRGGFEMALGNVIGSNIFNTLMVMSIPGFIGRIIVPKEVLYFHLPLLIGGSLLMLLMMLNKRMTKWKGMALVLFYFFFLIELFIV